MEENKNENLNEETTPPFVGFEKTEPIYDEVEEDEESEELDENEEEQPEQANQVYVNNNLTGSVGFKEWLVERLSIMQTLILTGIVSLISLFAFILFGNAKANYADVADNIENVRMYNSCLVLQIFFIIAFVIFISAFIACIVFNGKRKNQDRR